MYYQFMDWSGELLQVGRRKPIGSNLGRNWPRLPRGRAKTGGFGPYKGEKLAVFEVGGERHARPSRIAFFPGFAGEIPSFVVHRARVLGAAAPRFVGVIENFGYQFAN